MSSEANLDNLGIYDCYDCDGYNRIKEKCVNPKGRPDGTMWSCEYFKERT